MQVIYLHPKTQAKCMPLKKGENDSENFPGPKSRKSQNHSQALFLSDLDLKNLGLGLHRAAEEAFLAEKADFHRENMVFTELA